MPRVRDVMTRDPKTLGRNDRLMIADYLMKAERIRHRSGGPCAG